MLAKSGAGVIFAPPRSGHMISCQTVCIVGAFRRGTTETYVFSFTHSAGESVASSAVDTRCRRTAGGCQHGSRRRRPASRSHAAGSRVRGRHAAARAAAAVDLGRRPIGAALLQLLAEPRPVAIVLGQPTVPARLDRACVHLPPALLVAKTCGAGHADGACRGHRPAGGELRAAAVLRELPHRDDRHVHVCAGGDGRVSACRRLEHVSLVLGSARQPDLHVPAARRSDPLPPGAAADCGDHRQHLHVADDRARRVSRRQSDHPRRWASPRRGRCLQRPEDAHDLRLAGGHAHAGRWSRVVGERGDRGERDPDRPGL